MDANIQSTTNGNFVTDLPAYGSFSLERKSPIITGHLLPARYFHYIYPFLICEIHTKINSKHLPVTISKKYILIRCVWPGAASGRSYPTPPRPHARGQGQRPGGATHARGQGQWPGGPTPRPRSRGCAGPGGPRGAIPH